MDKFYQAYNQLCEAAVKDEAVFANFRQDPTCITVVDTSWKEVGDTCIDVIIDNEIDLFDKFITSDSIGNPVVFHYDKIGLKFSPNTLRYGKILAELIEHFGDLNKANIIEVGVGYGGQCKIIHDAFHPKSYTLLDYPEVLRLSKKYLAHFGVEVVLRDIMDGTKGKYNLFISNYAFSEIEKCWQIFYCQHIIRYVPRGFMVCNILTEREIINLMDKKNYHIIPEYPQTGLNNFVYIWDDER